VPAIIRSSPPRSGSGPGRWAATTPIRPAEDDLHFADEELTYLEAAEPAGQLIGALEPTIPPVLGEWTEEE
jgi:hypothetical protein